jgi:hypothetical protein
VFLVVVIVSGGISESDEEKKNGVRRGYRSIKNKISKKMEK